jgi:hypothetical protein
LLERDKKGDKSDLSPLRIASNLNEGQQFEVSIESNRRFENVFADLGIDVDAMNAEEAVRRIAPHPLRLHLVAALDGWADRRHNIVLVETHRGDTWWHRPASISPA